MDELDDLELEIIRFFIEGLIRRINVVIRCTCRNRVHIQTAEILIQSRPDAVEICLSRTEGDVLRVWSDSRVVRIRYRDVVDL